MPTRLLCSSAEERREEIRMHVCIALMSGWACRDEGRSGSGILGILGILRHERIAVFARFVGRDVGFALGRVLQTPGR
jgi:hypothetical protein